MGESMEEGKEKGERKTHTHRDCLHSVSKILSKFCMLFNQEAEESLSSLAKAKGAKLLLELLSNKPLA